MNPYLLAQLPFLPQQLPLPGIPGIAHTSPEAFEQARLLDPFWFTRLQSTFPHALSPLPPFMTLY